MFICFRIWPDIVKHRIRDTYMYFGGSLFATVAAAVSVSRSPRMMNLMMRNSWLVITPVFTYCFVVINA